MTKPTDSDASLGWIAIALMGGWAWFMAIVCPPFFWAILIVALLGLLGRIGGGSNYPDQNCGPGGPDAY